MEQFQFHKGTIKTQGFPARAEERGHFNSIKVRLKQGVAVRPSTLQRHFNSIKVRLKRDCERCEVRHRSIFQFHKGTIKT